MDLQAPCNICSSIHRKQALFRQLHSPNAINYPLNSLKFRRKIASELQTTVGTPSVNGNYSQSVPSHKVTVHDRQRGLVHEFVVPEDQYILHTAESQDIFLPFACRHGAKSLHCHTKSLVIGSETQNDTITSYVRKVTSLNDQGYALLCVGFPLSDIEVETQDEDEVYWLQFGRYFARGPIERDDYALELAMGDE